MRAQELVASVWLTAWEDAGKPPPPMKRVIVDWEKAAARDKEAPSKTGAALVVAAAFMTAILGWALLRARKGRRN
jgi:hypothetical protein